MANYDRFAHNNHLVKALRLTMRIEASRAGKSNPVLIFPWRKTRVKAKRKNDRE